MKLHCFVSVLSAFFFVNKTKSGFLVCILWSCFLFGCFVFNFCFLFFIPFQKKTQKPDTAKTKKQKCRKKDKKIQLAQLCSQIVFLIFWGWATKCYFCWKPYKIGVSAYFEKGKKGQKCEKGWVKNLSKVESKICPSMLRNIIGQMFDSKNGSFCLIFLFLLLLKNLILPAERRRCLKKKQIRKTKRKHWTDFWLKKGQILDRFLTLQPLQRVCIYIYIHML